jgi:hypothetical protein
MKREFKIESITKGADNYRTHYTTKSSYIESQCYVDEIRCVEKTIGRGIHNNITIDVYMGWVNGELRFEMEAAGGLLISYEK